MIIRLRPPDKLTLPPRNTGLPIGMPMIKRAYIALNEGFLGRQWIDANEGIPPWPSDLLEAHLMLTMKVHRLCCVVRA